MHTSEDFWYALRTFYAQELKVGRHLDSYDLTWFIPMRLVSKTEPKGQSSRHERRCIPYVHNLIFIKKPENPEELQRALDESPYSTQMYCLPESKEWRTIPESDILELRFICDQSFVEPIFISQKESDLMVGKMVRVIHGPLAGIHGRLIRKNKKYYVVKSMTGFGLMVSVSRWCCEEDDN